MYALPRRRKSDHEQCPMSPEQIDVMLANQQQLMKDMADIKKYLFAGRVVVGTLVLIGLTLDWTRDHVSFIKAWVIK
jgi:hypothetical protein